MALTLRCALGRGAHRARGGRRSRLVPRGIWKLQRGSNDPGDAVSISIAYVAGVDAFKQRHALGSAQEEAEKALEKFPPLQPRAGHCRPELISR